MIIDKLSPHDLPSFFSSENYRRGMEYYNDGQVQRIKLSGTSSEELMQIRGWVKGRGSMPYEVHIDLVYYEDDEKDPFFIESECSCPVGFDCKHVVATLLQTITFRREHAVKNGSNLISKADEYDRLLVRWMDQFEQELDAAEQVPEIDTSYELHFMLTNIAQANKAEYCLIEPKLLRRLKSGGLGAEKRCHFHGTTEKKHLLPNEDELLIKLELAHRFHKAGFYRNCFKLGARNSEELLQELLATKKCHSASNKDKTLLFGETKALNISWKTQDNGAQTLQFDIGLEERYFFLVESLWYFNPKQHEVGKVSTNLSLHVIKQLLLIPEVSPTKAFQVNSLLAKNVKTQAIPKLNVLIPKDVISCNPVPHLKLSIVAFDVWVYGNWQRALEPQEMPVALLDFDYQGIRVPWDKSDAIVSAVDGNELKKVARSFEQETMVKDLILSSGLTPVSSYPEFYLQNKDKGNHFFFTEPAPLAFWHEVLPSLREKGWVIEVEESYPYQVVEVDSSDWYANLEDEDTPDWFRFEMGIMVGEHQVNLLPVINEILKDLKNKKEIYTLEQRNFYTPLPGGHFAKIPGERVKSIVHSLVELFDHKSLTEDKLVLSKSQAARLIEIEKACGAVRLRWLGEHKMRELGEKLSEFKSIQPIDPPKSLQGELRPYQQEGLNWMQFLREYELAGILADDMGLGKTIQALSHILVEKESGRMVDPALVIAPTSLMYNWENEAKKFAPGLKVLVLHGPDRKQYLNTLAEFDLILTTYPLIVRDKALLLKQPFHLLMLDEAQNIKNSKSLAAQIALQLKAQHRLCLTGTPMENHLGELWSLYHFLMPGLLGDETFFKRTFRTPIEKHQDNDRRKILNQRIAPFLLRRTKDSVVKELPKKVEMTRFVEFDTAQRDLYESIRIAMEEKVRKEVEKLGLSRSHIVILDALLKLRQVCCDPSLLKMQTAQKSKAKSSKMQLIKTLLPELIEEGRRILLFSQFTGMLSIIEDAVTQLNIPYVKLTGQTIDRKTPIERFQNQEVPLFLISLKAGGTGLNLTAADTVIHYDPWWNPAVENQATDRAHRIGQGKTVFVYKIVTKGTVEEKIIAMQNKKRSLAESLYSDKSTGESKITENDLKALFSPL